MVSYNRHPAGSPGGKGGQFAPKNKKAAALVKLAKKIDQATVKDMAVNTAGLAGSIAGGAVAGPLGALAGDLVGALAARQAVNVGTSVMTAKDKLSRNKRFQRARALEKTKQLIQATLIEMSKNEDNLGDELTGDLSGWLIGNASAMGLNLVSSLAGVPMKGAVVAMATVPKLVRLRKKLKQ
jgi:hypothetical protein